jgi:hypothetical protein
MQTPDELQCLPPVQLVVHEPQCESADAPVIAVSHPFVASPSQSAKPTAHT